MTNLQCILVWCDLRSFDAKSILLGFTHFCVEQKLTKQSCPWRQNYKYHVCTLHCKVGASKLFWPPKFSKAAKILFAAIGACQLFLLWLWVKLTYKEKTSFLCILWGLQVLMLRVAYFPHCYLLTPEMNFEIAKITDPTDLCNFIDWNCYLFKKALREVAFFFFAAVGFFWKRLKSAPLSGESCWYSITLFVWPAMLLLPSEKQILGPLHFLNKLSSSVDVIATSEIWKYHSLTGVTARRCYRI